MTRVAIYPVPSEKGGQLYQGVSGDKHSEGSTIGEAIDALTAQLPEQDGLVVLVQSLRPDRFFDAQQQQRLTHLMAQWRTARDSGGSLPLEEQQELDALIEAELKASGERAASVAGNSPTTG